jgi:LmbE family N-acetylglucosaminyl deacetylase
MARESAPLAIFAHPGHELRILHALKQLQARSLFLTDASASTGQSRMHLTERTLKSAGLPPREPFSARPDKIFYAALASGDDASLRALRQDIIARIEHQTPRLLITDSAEGYNPVHDLCHFLVVSIAGNFRIPVFDIALDGDPADFGHARRADCLDFTMDESELSGKLALIQNYISAAGPQLSQEAENLLARYGRGAQAREILRPALEWPQYDATFRERTPFFEAHGRRRVREGKYASALTYRTHLRPILESLMVAA